MMKRQIKFRAWDGEQMHYNIVPWQWDFVISLAWHKCEKSTGTGILGSGGPTGEFLVPGIRFKELMQFTGLHDKNGKEIYEGDIIKPDNSRYACKVTWSDKYASFVLTREGWAFRHYFGEACDPEDFEVIGNIYENPELLEP
jgi:uncharacterized phage protein (TIGR01671 family)